MNHKINKLGYVQTSLNSIHDFKKINLCINEKLIKKQVGSEKKIL